MRRWQQVLVAVGLVVLGAALATLPQVVRAGEPERKATVELMKVVVPRETYQDMVARMSAAVRESFVQGGVEVPADRLDSLDASLLSGLFAEAHHRTFMHAGLDRPVEIVTLRVGATLPIGTPPRTAAAISRWMRR